MFNIPYQKPPKIRKKSLVFRPISAYNEVIFKNKLVENKNA